MPSRIILGLLLLLGTPILAQTNLDQFNNRTPLVTKPYDYSYKAKRSKFENDLPHRRFQRLDGTIAIKRQQSFAGIPVWGAEIADVYDGDQLLTRTGHYAHLYTFNSEPTLGSTDAIALSAAYFKTDLATAELWIYPAKQTTHLVWLVRENNFASNYYVFVDAHSGHIHNAYQSIHSGMGVGVLGDEKEVASSGSSGNYVLDHTEFGVRRRTYTASGTTNLPGVISSDADNTWDSASQAAAVDAHYYAGLTLDFLREKLDRNSFDDLGSEVQSTVNYGNNYVNAFWNGSQMVYGDGDLFTATALSASFDIVAHEIAHAVTDYTSRLIYQNDSGALNEAFSDIFAVAAEYYYQPEQFDWMIGEDCWTPFLSGDALRYMFNPALDGSSRAHFAEIYRGPADNGGVHINSGMVNLAFFLAVEGGLHPQRSNLEGNDMEVFGIGMERAFNIFYSAFTLLPPNATYQTARDLCVATALNLYGEGERIAINNAWAIVGIGEFEFDYLANGGWMIPDVPIEKLKADPGEWVHLQLNLPVGATNLVIQTSGGSGDADLYTRFSAQPTTTDFTHRPYRSGNEERIIEVEPVSGIWYIGIRAYSGFKNVTVSVAYDLPDDDNNLPNETLDMIDLHAETEAWHHFTVEVHTVGPMLIEMQGGEGDADLYVRYGEQPEITDWDYRPFNLGNQETVAIDTAIKGTWHISVHGSTAFSGVSLEVSYPAPVM